jgi:thymidine phosphorylase
LHSGAARAKFDEIVEAQGRRTPPARPGSLTHTVHASASGRVRAIDILQISEIARRAGAPVDKAAGVDLAARVGDEVRGGDVLYTIHASAAVDLEAAAAIADIDTGVR